MSDSSDPKKSAEHRSLLKVSELKLLVVRADFNPLEKNVRLKAEAKTAFSDESTDAGRSIAFYLNGTRIDSLDTDQCGIACLDRVVSCEYFLPNDNLLAIRTPGFAKEAICEFRIDVPKLTFRHLRHWWEKKIPAYEFDWNSNGLTQKWIAKHDKLRKRQLLGYRLENLNLLVQIEQQIAIRLVLRASYSSADGGEYWTDVGSAITSDDGFAQFKIQDYYFDATPYEDAKPYCDLEETQREWALFADKERFYMTFFVLNEPKIGSLETFNEKWVAERIPWPSNWLLKLRERHILSVKEYEGTIQTLPLSRNLHRRRLVVTAVGWPNSDIELDVSTVGVSPDG